MKQALALLCLTLLTATAAIAEQKGKPMSRRASGSFEVKMEPIASEAFPRMKGTKQLHGDLEGTATSEMMSVMSEEEGSGAYAAIERVTGSLHGRKGSFVLIHSGTMRRGGEFSMIIRVVPDSGTGELKGLTGTFEIVFQGKDHLYNFDYTLPE
jgi:hypothetical protein